jgi:hypothetical protein
MGGVKWRNYQGSKGHWQRRIRVWEGWSHHELPSTRLWDGKKKFNVIVEKLGAIIHLERANGGAKLCACVCKEIYESARHTRLVTKWERPIIVRI